MIIAAFCVSGGHSVTLTVNGDPNEVRDLPEGWRMVMASCIPAPIGPDDPWAPGIWYADPGSGCWILCCPDHPIINAHDRKDGLS